MIAKDLSAKLTILLEPIAHDHGFELVAVEQAGGRHTPVIRVLLDREGGVDIDAICAANTWVSEALDEADPISGPYTLEVSTPGVDRPLTKLEDYERFTGQTAKVKTRPDASVRGAWTGTIVGREGESILLDVDGDSVTVPFDDIAKARLKGAVSFDRGRDDN
ncbi:MAG: ribosome maturation factor RimP [Coriobacteriia bacterium]|nr:ribosome maturation factor RimP [Coriobacteriia bacterium]